MYPSGVRRLAAIFPVLTLALGCRPPGIPDQPTASEYAVYNAYLEQASPTLPRELSFAVDAATLKPVQSELQFQQCLPRRMENVFSNVPSTLLASTSGNHCLDLGDGPNAPKPEQDLPLTNTKPTQFFRFSRVAFTRFESDAYLYVETRRCGEKGFCEAASGVLTHGRKSGSTWTFEDTTWESTVLPQ